MKDWLDKEARISSLSTIVFQTFPNLETLTHNNPLWMLGIAFVLLEVLNMDPRIQEKNPQRNERSVYPSLSTPTKSHKAK